MTTFWAGSWFVDFKRSRAEGGANAVPPPGNSRWDQVYRERAVAYERGNHKGAVSGVGSTKGAAAPLMQYLRSFLEARPGDVNSMVEASCGHWPSGWQSAMTWPGHLNYTGVDLLSELVYANAKLVATCGVASFGLRSARFVTHDMVDAPLPPADLLLTKDTLSHLSNQEILNFVALSVLTCPPRYKYILFAQDQLQTAKLNLTLVPDRDGQGHRALDLALAPFSLNVTTVMTYPSGRCCSKAVQLMDLRHYCRVRPLGGRSAVS